MDLRPWVILCVTVVGNCGFWLFLFNQLNSTALPRHRIKFYEKFFVAACFVIPLLILFLERASLASWLSESGAWWPTNAPLYRSYGAWCCASFLVLGIPWLESRLWMLPPRHQQHVEQRAFDVHKAVEGGSPGTSFTSFLNRLPGNDICKLHVNCKKLTLPRKLDKFAGLRIGHISDLHFTGQLRVSHYEFVLDKFMELEPDLIIVSGDIIDKERCLAWLEPLLGKLSAPLGTSFVLGNHDRRLPDIPGLSARLQNLGMFDLGQSEQKLEVPDRGAILLEGNELPWFNRLRNNDSPAGSELEKQDEGVLRIGVSHSPDQIPWARRRKHDLLLAGHTHGGQIRVPGIGPLVSPSRHGSRFASGVFFLAPTLVHVSRGVAGTHPVRWWCKPEVSVLELRNPS